jgi:hypothetical protein
MQPQQYAKAIVAGAVAALWALATAVADGKLTAVEIIGVVAAGVVAAGAVFQVPNATPPDS